MKTEMSLTHKKILDDVFRKIPELRKNKVIALPQTFFMKLSDLEFELLYRMPGLTIRIHPRTYEYIEIRRQLLKLPKAVTFEK